MRTGRLRSSINATSTRKVTRWGSNTAASSCILKVAAFFLHVFRFPGRDLSALLAIVPGARAGAGRDPFRELFFLRALGLAVSDIDPGGV